MTLGDNPPVGDLLDLRCECGYRAEDELVSGLMMSGAVFELFVCGTCREVVSAETGSYFDDPSEGAAPPECPLCGGRPLAPWGNGDIALAADVERR